MDYNGSVNSCVNGKIHPSICKMIIYLFRYDTATHLANNPGLSIL